MRAEEKLIGEGGGQRAAKGGREAGNWRRHAL